MRARSDAVSIWRTLMETTAADPLPDLAPLLRRPEWMERAACAELEAPAGEFFPGRGRSPDLAKAICGTCLVRRECLAYALDDPTVTGVWGGTTDAERAAQRRAHHT